MLPPSLVVVPLKAPPSLRCCVDRLNLVNTLQYISAKHCRCRGCGHRSEASETPTTTHWPRRPSGSTRTNECIRADSPFRRGPLRNLGDVELVTADYVAWYNQQRLMHRLGRIPPAEAEAEYYDQLDASQPAGSQNPEGA
jgi:putative transposase